MEACVYIWWYLLDHLKVLPESAAYLLVTSFFLNCAEELKMKRKKQLKKDTASKIKSLVDEVMDLFFAEVF